jgi:hypothetical protein
MGTISRDCGGGGAAVVTQRLQRSTVEDANKH